MDPVKSNFYIFSSVSESLAKGIEDVKGFPYQVALTNGSSVHKFFLNAKKGSIYHQLLKSGKIKPTKDNDAKWIKSAVKSMIF